MNDKATQLLNVVDESLLESFLNADKEVEQRIEFLNSFTNEELENYFVNDDYQGMLYRAINRYLAYRIFDHYPLSKREHELLDMFSELDDYKAVSFELTVKRLQEILESSLNFSIFSNEIDDFKIILMDKVNDGTINRLEMDFLKMVLSEEDYHHIESILEGMNNRPSVEYITRTYGYNIYDKKEVYERFINLAAPDCLPISRREKVLIEKYHQELDLSNSKSIRDFILSHE